MRKRCLLSAILAIAMILSLLIPVLAADSSYTTALFLTAEEPALNVTLPTSIPVHLNSDGSVTCPSELKIINNSAGPVEVRKIRMTEGDWQLTDYNGGNRSILSLFGINSRKLGFQLEARGDTAATASGGAQDLEHNTQKWVISGNGGQMPISCSSISTAVSAATESAEPVGNIEFTIAWSGTTSFYDTEDCPQIIVTAPTGSDVSCEKESLILTTDEDDGMWTFNVPELGQWTVRCGTLSRSVTVEKVSSYGASFCEQVVNYTMLYDHGDECEEITGGWIEYAASDDGLGTGYKAVKNPTSMTTIASSHTNRAGRGFRTSNNIVLDGYKSVGVNVLSGQASTAYGSCGWLGFEMAGRGTGSKGIHTLDGASGTYPIYVGGYAGNGGITYDAVFLLKEDNYLVAATAAGLSTSSINDLLAQSETLLANQEAVNAMVSNCTGDFMIAAINNETFMNALADSPYAGIVYSNEHWAKFLAMSDYAPTTHIAESIAITTPPDKTEYEYGDNFDPTGMVVTATMKDGSTREVTNYNILGGKSLTGDIASITVRYGAATTTQAISVIVPLTGIEVVTAPDKTVYEGGEAFDPTGMVVRATYADGNTKELTQREKEYVVLDYLQSTGSQYIDTQFASTRGWRTELTYAFNNTSSTRHMAIGDLYYDGNNYFRSYVTADNGKWHFGFYSNCGTTGSVSPNTKYNIEAKTVSGDGYLKVNGNTLFQHTTTYSAHPAINTYLFADNYPNSSLESGSGGKLYSCLLYDHNDILVRDFIPVKQISTNTLGLYDKVENKFYTNAGSGTFTAGAETGEYVFDNGVIASSTPSVFIISNGNSLIPGQTNITISYTDGGITKTCEQSITVEDWEQLVNYTMLYHYGDECEDVTGGWVVKDYHPGDAGAFVTNNSFDLSKYKSYMYVFSGWTSDGGRRNALDSIKGSFFMSPGTGSKQNVYSKMNMDYESTLGIRVRQSNCYSLSLEKKSDHFYLYHWSSRDYYGSCYAYHLSLFKPDEWQTLCSFVNSPTPTTIESLLSDSDLIQSIVSDQNAMSFMAKQCTGEFMGAAINNKAFVSALAASPHADIVYSNPHWAKFLAMVS